MIERPLAIAACALLGALGCSYPEFDFTPADATTIVDTGEPLEVADSALPSDDGDATLLADDDILDTSPAVDSAVDTSVVDTRVDAPSDVRDSAGTTLTLLAKGAVWRYLDDGSLPASTWRGGGGFDDSKWKSGAAQLGYGDGDETTVISKGPADAGDAGDAGTHYPAYYFRRFITVTGAASFDTVTIHLLRDDGAVVYFNGSEVLRSNMPAGTITNTTFAASTIPNVEENVYFTAVVPAATLAEGANVIAVEVHQSSAASSDVGFDLELIGHKP